MPLPELALALLALLLTPGPTNTLMAIAGAERGFARSAALIPASAAAYLLVTVPLALAGAEILAAFPALRSVVTIAAAAWVAVLAIRLWKIPSAAADAPAGVTASGVFVTTLLNPKALVIGLVLLPSATSLAPRVAVLAGLVAVAASGWLLLGSLLSARPSNPASRHLPVLRRAGACWLGLLSAGLAAAGLS